MSNHFDSIADIYNQSWHFSEQYQQQMLDTIVELLGLAPQDTLVDIGGGTGVYTRLLQQAVDLRKAYCIEPSRNMYLEACKLPEIQSICADAEGFMKLGLAFTKVLVKEAVHHIREREILWRHLYEKLPPQGKILLVTRPKEIQLPLFAKAKAAFANNQPHQDVLCGELESAGFTASVKLHPYRFRLDKDQWFSMIRNRFMSDLSGFTEEEIEEGIAEIDREYQGQSVEIPDNILYILATKTGRPS